MIFQYNDHVEKIAQGLKTQTRRLEKPGDQPLRKPGGVAVIMPDGRSYEAPIQAVLRADGRTRYEIGQAHAVQPGRGKPTARVVTRGIGDITISGIPGIGSPLRIRILSIRHERACDISEADTRAEGFPDRAAFLACWDEIHPGKREANVWMLKLQVAGQ